MMIVGIKNNLKADLSIVQLPLKEYSQDGEQNIGQQSAQKSFLAGMAVQPRS